MYKVIISEYAQKQFKKIDRLQWGKIAKAIEELGQNPRPHGYKKLKGRDAYRIRIGDYRVIYEIRDRVLIVEVVEIGNRRDIYD